ncbi:MAG: hypothetical protein AB1405_02565 [Bdellovibrionota bacterium]
MELQKQELPIHPACRVWSIRPGRLSAEGRRTGFSLLNIREWASNPKLLEHRLTILAEVRDAVIEFVTASEPLYFGHVNYGDEYNLVFPTGHHGIDAIEVRTALLDADTAEVLGFYSGGVGDIIVHPVGLCHWPGYMSKPEFFRPPSGPARFRILSMVYCSKGAVKYNDSAQEKKTAGLEWPSFEVHPDFADWKIRECKADFPSEKARKRAGFVPLRALVADKNRKEDEITTVGRVGETRWDLIVSAGGPKKAFASGGRSYLIGYAGQPRLELLAPDGAPCGTADLEEADLLEIPASCGFRITGTGNGKRSAILWFRENP